MTIAFPPRLCALLVVAGAVAPAIAQDPGAAQNAARDLVVQASRIVLSPEQTLAPGRVLIRQGKVAYVGNDIPSDARLRARSVDYGDAVIVPGFVLAHTTLGQAQDLAESALAFTPDLHVAEAFDPWQKQLDELASHGVTSFALGPSPRNVAGGIAALGKPGKQQGRIAADDLQLVLSLNAAARTDDRPPTSLMGAVDLLRTAFAMARDPARTGPDAAVLRQALDGSRRVFCYADSYAELNALLNLSAELGLAPVVLGGAEADKVLARLQQQKAGVVLPPLAPELRLAQLELPAKLAEAGVPFCFGGSPTRLRMSAVLAVRHGLDRKVALQALTRVPAALTGQQANVGALRQGCAGDFVVFSGDPLDLTSKHVATWVDGELLFGSLPAKRASTAPATPAAAATATGEQP